ncbi:MAG TPA: LPS export ABC transporter periplasmic protein LptC, partial [Allocoleopsis sp.]
AVVNLLDPPLDITGNLLEWNVKQKKLVADQPVTVVHRTEQITLTADKGRMEFEPKIAYFDGNARAVGQKNQSQLTADHLNWDIKTQQVNAEGNVVYVQPDPPATLKGPRAVGKLQDQTVVVSGGRVETQIVPQGVKLP